MRSTEETHINECELKMGEEMNVITFGELITELTGVPYEKIYKEFLFHGEYHEGNME